jgi:hypothetical protein
MAKKVLTWEFLVMIRLLLAAALALATPGPLSAQTQLQPSTDAMKSVLAKVISQQLAAFRADDFPRAYGLAAREIKSMFPLPLFEQMVRTNYRALLEKVAPSFGIALDDGRQGVVFLEIDGSQGPQVFRYLLKLEPGGWKISGVEQTQDNPPQKAPLSA